MDAGEGMVYAAQCVDGRVHADGGGELREELQGVRGRIGGVLKPGGAVSFEAPGWLFYDALVHAVGPLGDSSGAFESVEEMRRRDRAVIGSVYNAIAPGRILYEGLGNEVGAVGEDSGAFETLRRCYASALACVAEEVEKCAEGAVDVVVAAIPLIGSGVGGMSVLKVATAATDAVGSLPEEISHFDGKRLIVRFVAQREGDAKVWGDVVVGHHYDGRRGAVFGSSWRSDE